VLQYTPIGGKKIVFNVFKRLKKPIRKKKEKKTNNIMMAKCTQTPKISKLGSFGKQTQIFTNTQNVLLLGNFTKAFHFTNPILLSKSFLFPTQFP